MIQRAAASPPVPEPSADTPSADTSSIDIHIAGVLVHCRPASVDPLQRAIAALDRAELFQSSADGKLVVVIEAESSVGVVETIDALRELPGVLNVSLVYQHAEPASSLQQEIDP